METEYSNKIHKNTNELADVFIKMLAKTDGLFLMPDASEEDKKKQEEMLTDLGLAFIGEISKTDLQWTQVFLIFKKIENLLAGATQFTCGTIASWDDEATSRLYGTKLDGKYRKEQVTVADLSKILKEAREKTGNDIHDYVN